MPRAHWEVMRGTPQQASDYCKKDGNYEEDGTLPENGRHKGGESTKRKYEAAKELAMAGNIEDIDADIYIRHYNTLKRIKTDHQERIPPIDELIISGLESLKDSSSSFVLVNNFATLYASVVFNFFT